MAPDAASMTDAATRFDAPSLASAAGGELLCAGRAPISGGAIDSRLVAEGVAFFALAGEAWPHDPSVYAWGARLWIGGATLLVAVLFLTAAAPRVRYALPIPALAVTGGAAAFALSFLSTQGVPS